MGGEPPALLRGREPVGEELIEGLARRGRRTFQVAFPGSDELRYLDVIRANANVGGEKLTDILLRDDPRRIEVWEEFLHGTQYKCGVIDRLGFQEAEAHVKRFMIRHRRLLSITEEDAAILEALIGEP